MEAKDLSQFHELAEALKGEMKLRDLCVQEHVSYRAYSRWRTANGIALRSNRKNNQSDAQPSGLIELDVVGRPDDTTISPKALVVHIEFENGLRYDRNDLEVDTLVEFLTKIRGALCLG